MASVDAGNPRHFHVTIQGPGEVRLMQSVPQWRDAMGFVASSQTQLALF